MKKYLSGYIAQTDPDGYRDFVVPSGKSWELIQSVIEFVVTADADVTLGVKTLIAPKFHLASPFTGVLFPQVNRVSDTITTSTAITVSVLVYLKGYAIVKDYTDTANSTHADAAGSTDYGFPVLLDNDTLRTAIFGFPSTTDYTQFWHLVEETPLI